MASLLEWNIAFKCETIVWMDLINWKYVWMPFKFMLNGLVKAIYELVIQSQVVTFVYESYNIIFLKAYELHILCKRIIALLLAQLKIYNSVLLVQSWLLAL